MNNINQIPIVLHSMDSYSNYWNPWFLQLKKYLINYGKIYFISEEKPPDFLSEVYHIKTGKGEWGERLLYALSKISEDLIFYMQEDFWAKKELVLTDNILKLFIKYNMIQLHIKKYVNGMGIFYEYIEDKIYKMRQNSTYTQNHQFALWVKNDLQKNILPNESPWENEINGTKRLNLTPHRIYLYENDWYESVCTKGVLNERGKDLILHEKIIF